MNVSHTDRRNMIAGAIGNAIEFYDFIVYAYLAHYFASQFFPSDDPVTALIASYGGFAAGMLMRPLGGVLIGSIGDRIGRKMALQISVLMISLPTVAIGFLPTYDSIGLWAPVLLLLMRLVQGLSVGGEYSAAIVFLVERASPKERGFFGSFSPMGAIFGLLLGSLVTFIFTLSLGQEIMNDWGWRLPFISSIVLMLFGIWLRSKIAADIISKSDSAKSPVIDAFKMYWRQMLSIGLGNTLTGAMSFIGFMYAVPWMIEQGGIHSTLAFSINIISLALCCVMTIFGGIIGDKIGRLKTVMIGALIALCGVWPAFLFFKSGILPLMLLSSVIIGTAHGLFCGHCFRLQLVRRDRWRTRSHAHRVSSWKTSYCDGTRDRHYGGRCRFSFCFALGSSMAQEQRAISRGCIVTIRHYSNIDLSVLIILGLSCLRNSAL
jgi:MHS family proline/betaine transporter-like MFS transporter